jgi:transposase InsO family protein
MDERTQFIAACLLAEESMSALCRGFGISRKSGYKWLARYEAGGPPALVDRSHAPHRQPAAVPAGLARAILAGRAKHPQWGPRKLRAWLAQRGDGPWPAPSTIGVLLHRAGLTVARRRRPRRPDPGVPTAAAGANAVWAADFKGWFRTGDGRRCDPLTISDLYSRYLLRCQVVGAAQLELVQPLFEATFREYGLPHVIRTDNGPPFGGLGLLSRLAVWWIRLGIRPERIAPGHPEQNAVHERMHRTLKAETAAPPQATLTAQQRAFDRFRREYNDERPHEALGQRPPATAYTGSPRCYPARLPEVEYPETFVVRRAHPNGDIKWRGHRVRTSEALAGQLVGVEAIADGQWRVWFGPVALGWLDARRPERLHRQLITHKLLPISPV